MRPNCTVPGCEHPQRRRVWCATHYARWFRTGSPTGSTAVPFDYDANFWRRVTKATGCWEWTGHRLPTGHGRLWLRGRMTLAHRHAWTLLVGAIPDAAMVLHRCDNPPCVRPDHLFLGTRADNNADKMAKGRWRGGDHRGTNNPAAKLTDDAVRAIRSERDAGVSLKDIAASHGVSDATVSLIVRGRIWRHVEAGGGVPG